MNDMLPVDDGLNKKHPYDERICLASHDQLTLQDALRPWNVEEVEDHSHLFPEDGAIAQGGEQCIRNLSSCPGHNHPDALGLRHNPDHIDTASSSFEQQGSEDVLKIEP